MANRDNKSGLTDAIPAAIVIGVVAFVIMMIADIICDIAGVSLDIDVIVRIVSIAGVTIVAGFYQHMVNKQSVTIGQMGIDIVNLTVSERASNALVKELEAQIARLVEEIDERKRLEKCNSALDEISENAVKGLIGAVASTYTLRRTGGVKSARLGELQDDWLIAILAYLAQCIPVDYDRAKKLGALADPLWDTAALDHFFAPHRDQIVGALKELKEQKNRAYIDAVFALPTDVVPYFTRLTLTHQAEQPAAVPPG